jgi:hypothetical protein
MDHEHYCVYDEELVLAGAFALSEVAAGEATRAPIAPLTFNRQGPQGRLTRIDQDVKTSDGPLMRARWVVPWTAGLDNDRHSRSQVRDWVRTVLTSSQGWLRAGIWYRYVDDPGQARIIFRYLLPGKIKGGMGMYQAHDPGMDFVTIASNRFGRGFSPVVLHEGGHYLRCNDKYKGVRCHNPNYHGLYGQGTGVLTPNDVACTLDWLASKAKICG